MGGNGSYCESSPMFCGKIGTTWLEKLKEPLFVGLRGGWGGVLSNMPEAKWGKIGGMGENGSYCESYLMFC